MTFSCSTPECKVNIIRVMRSILRENLRRNMQKVEQQSERVCKKRLSPLRKTLPASAKLGQCELPFTYMSDTVSALEVDNIVLHHSGNVEAELYRTIRYNLEARLQRMSVGKQLLHHKLALNFRTY